MKILGMGNALVDILIELENDDLLTEFRLPKASMTLVDSETSNFIHVQTAGLKKTLASGGSAANTVHGLANLGVQVSYIGKIGNDEMGKFFEKDMEASKIQPALYRSMNETGRAMALVSPDSERTFATCLGAAVELSVEDITSNVFQGFEYFYIEGYLINNKELFEKSLRLAKENNLKTCVDLASYNIVEQFKETLLPVLKQYVDIVFANEEEAKVLTGKEPEAALDEILQYSEIAVVKTGSGGSLIGKDDIRIHVPANKVTSKDTTGAGDLYASGFLYGLIHNQPLEICGKIGTLLAGNVIEVIGAKLSNNKWKLIRKEIAVLMNE